MEKSEGKGERSAVELWELQARESIRDLVARYNANGDTGRFEQLLEVFAPDAVMEVVSPDGARRRFEGRGEIRGLFAGTAAGWAGERGDDAPRYVRHFTATHQIDVVSPEQALGRCYFFVVMAHGPDHWGRYVDRYGVRDGRWLITHRQALSDPRTSPRTEA